MTSGDPGFLRRCITVAAVAAGAVLVIWFVWATAHALLLLFSAFLVAVAIDGLARLVRKLLPVTQHTAVALTVVALAVLLGTALTMGSLNVAAQAPQLRKQIEHSVDRIQSKMKHYHLAENLVHGSSSSDHGVSSHSNVLGEKLTGELSGAASFTLTTITDMFLIVVVGLYFALGPDLYQNSVLRLFPPSRQERVAYISAQAAYAIRRWLTGRIISMMVVGVGSAVGLWLIGIPFPLLLGLIARLLTFIPYLGALVSAVPALLIAVLHGYAAVAYVGGLYLGLHILEGYLLSPWIQKQAVSIAPGFLLSAQVLGAAVAGVLGIALAAPIALVAAVIVQLSYVHDVMGETPHLPGRNIDDE